MKYLYIAVIGIFVFIFLSILSGGDTQSKIEYKVASSNISNSTAELNITISDENMTPIIEESVVFPEENETKENNDTNSTTIRYCSEKVHVYSDDGNYTRYYELDDKNRVVLIKGRFGNFFEGEMKFSYSQNSNKAEFFNSKKDTYAFHQDDTDEYNRNTYHRRVYRDSDDNITENSVSIEYDDDLQEPNSDEDIKDINNLTKYNYIYYGENQIKYYEKYNEDGKKILAYTTLNGKLNDRIVYKYNDNGSLASKTFLYKYRTSKTIFYSNNGKKERIFEESFHDLISDINYSDDHIFQDELSTENIYNDKHKLIESRTYDDGNLTMRDEYKYDKNGDLLSDVEYDENGSITTEVQYKNGELIKVIEDGKVIADAELIPCD